MSSLTGPYGDAGGSSPAYQSRMVDRIDNDITSNGTSTPSMGHKVLDMSQYDSDIEQPRMRRFSTTGLTDKDDKMLSNLLEKLEHVGGALPGPEASITYHRKWRPMTLEPESAFQRMLVEFYTNPLIPPVEISPEVQAKTPRDLVWRMTVMYSRKLIAEAIGTFVNAYWAGCIRILALTGNTDLTGVTIQIAGMIIGMIYSMAHISGGHFNPAVTWMFALKGIFPWKWVVPYMAAQLAGGLVGGGFLWAYWGLDSGSLSVNYYKADIVPNFVVTNWIAMFQEAMTFWFLGFVVLMCLKQIEKVGVVFPIIVGWVLISIGQINGVYTGWSSNPFRTLGPCLVFGNCYSNEVWIYVAGPMIGATCAVITCVVLDHKNRMIEKVACSGGAVSPEYT